MIHTVSKSLKAKYVFIFQYFSFYEHLKGVCALRGYFGPPVRSEMKIAFHKFLLVSLLEQLPKCKSLGLILFLPFAMVTKMATKIG